MGGGKDASELSSFLLSITGTSLRLTDLSRETLRHCHRPQIFLGDIILQQEQVSCLVFQKASCLAFLFFFS